MSVSLRDCAEGVRRLAEAAMRLDAQARMLQLPPLGGREWYELLRGKLLPQLTDDAFLIAAVVGGTNIGKSVVFNHLAGSHISAISPNAAGTKHPVCLLPSGFEESHDLAGLFDGFTLRAWDGEQDALRTAADDLLFWRTAAASPPNLLVLDTPDIDSNAAVNWGRAEKVRRAADVLIAVLTQEKYNDAAVKTFFRHAAAEDKAVIVVFNKLELPEDEEFWPGWLATFCEATGIAPMFVYLAPRNRKAAEALALPFYERLWPPQASGGSHPQASGGSHAQASGGSDAPGNATHQPLSPEQNGSLTEALTRLHFDDVKLRSLRGALLRITNNSDGAAGWLREVTARSNDFRAAAAHVAAERVVERPDWPAVPFPLVFDEFWAWWKGRRTGWTRGVSDVYDTVNRGVTWPFRKVRDHLRGGDIVDPLTDYKRTELDAVMRTTDEVFGRLKLLGEAGGELIRPHFERLATGAKKEALVAHLKAAHATVDVQEELRSLIAADMTRFLAEQPRVASWLGTLDALLVGTRPVLTVLLALVGAHGVAVPAQHVVMNAALDIFAGTAASAAGNAAVNTVGGGLGAALVTRLLGLQTKFAARRATWLAGELKVHLLGNLPEDLQTAANLPQSPAFAEVQAALAEVRSVLAATAAQAPKVAPPGEPDASKGGEPGV